jgi:hypothetical protein
MTDESTSNAPRPVAKPDRPSTGEPATATESSSSAPRPGEKPDRNPRKTALVVAAVALVAIAAIAVVNRDRLPSLSALSTPRDNPQATTSPANQPPEILSLEASTDRIQPFTVVGIACEASDPDGDALTYTWSVSSGDVFGEGPRIEWGSPAAEGLYQVSVTVDDGRGKTAQSSTPLRVKANVAPEIVSLTAAADWVVGGGSVFLSCEATDVDGDDVTLEWTATGGQLYGQGDAVIWLAPDEDAVHWITVLARDTYGAESERKLSISVTSGQPTEILDMQVQSLNTDLLFEHEDGWHIYQGRSCTITCVLGEESGAVTYVWTADFGKLVADGPVATWTAPSSGVSATVAVSVTDEAGNTSSASVIIHVETCTCHF